MQTSFKKSFMLLLTLLTLIVNAVGVTPAYAATLTVVNSNDSGAGSLRQAIADSASGDTITFDPSLSGATINLASTLTLTKNVTIDGSPLASQVTISGDADNSSTGNAGDVRVFYVNSGVTATLNRLMIARGYMASGNGRGGGIYNDGTLTILNSTFTNNYATNWGGGGIYNAAGKTLTVNGSTFTNNTTSDYGGAIWNQGGTVIVSDSTFSGNRTTGSAGGALRSDDGSLTVTNSNFSGNSAASYGGAIFLAGTTGSATVSESTFIGNSASFGGGIGVYDYTGATPAVKNSTFSGNSASGMGGGIYTWGMSVANSTFSGNSATFGGGIVSNGGGTSGLAVANSTFSGNSASFGGAVYRSGGTLMFTSTIIANSLSSGNCSGTITNGGGNIDSGTTCGFGTANGSMSSTNPLLDVLADNGGPTQTFALLANSPALGAGDDATCAAAPVNGLDQRGEARPQGDTSCDIGAYESNLSFDTTAPNAPVITAPPAFTNDATPTISGTAEADSWINVWYFDNLGDPTQICQDVLVDGSGDWSCISSVSLPERYVELAVNATDEAGNISSDASRFFTVDLTDPDESVVMASSAFTNDGTPTVSGTAEADNLVYIWYFDNHGDPVQICRDVPVDGSGAWSCNLMADLPEGEITLYLMSYDEAGNPSDVALCYLTVDLTAPDVPVVIAPSANAYSSDATPTMSGTAEADSWINIWYFDDHGDPIQICQDVLVDGLGDWSCVSSVSLPERYIELAVNAADEAGNISLDASRFFTVDLTALTVNSIVRADRDNTNAASVNFTVTFSEIVTGVNASAPFDDFSLFTTGVTGASITAVHGSGLIYTVTVNTGFGNGTIRLEVVDDDSIQDATHNPLAGGFTTGETYTITKSNGPATVGVFRPSNGALYLKNTNATGFADVAINYGIGGDYPIAGDWDGNGDATIGVYRNGAFYLRNSNTIGYADFSFAFGIPGDQPVVGDWDGDGDDTIGVYRNGIFYLSNTNTSGAPEITFSLGMSGDVGIAGDWNGDGKDTTGVFRPSNGALYLKNTNATGFADIQINYGLPGDKPVTGDWNNDGTDTIGVYRNGTFYLRNTNTVGFADIVFALGINGDMPIAGNWDGLP